MESKKAVVSTYEFGLTRAVDAAGLRRDVGWTQEELNLPPATDLPLRAWRQLAADRKSVV